MRKVIPIIIFLFSTLLAPASAFASNGQLLALSIDTGCIKNASQAKDKSVDQAYKDFRSAIESARSAQGKAIANAKKDKKKIKSAQQTYRSAIAQANKDLSSGKKNASNTFKAEVSLCKR